MNVPPTRRYGEMLSTFEEGGTSLIDEIHAAEISDAVINHYQFSVIPSVQDTQNGKAVKGFPERMKGMNLDPRLLHLGEEDGRGSLTADRIVKDAHIQPRAGAFLEGLCHGGAGDVIEKNVTFHPHPLLRGLDVPDQ